MSITVRYIDAPPEAVFAVLADGWLFANWVVGAARMRDVDEAWPAPGARLHHSFGSWPFFINDKTVMYVWDPPHHAEMNAHGWPIGEALIKIDVKPRGRGCVVKIWEDAVEGPGRLVPKLVRTIGLALRNRESLRRLAFLAEGGARSRRP
ncbi:MAG: SRPBCC family protein [Naasia sp.]